MQPMRKFAEKYFRSQINIRNAATNAAGASKPLQEFNKSMAKNLQEYRDSGWWHETFDYARLQGTNLIGKDGKRYVNLLSNAYLMLSGNPRVVNAAKMALDEYKCVGSHGSGKLIGLEIHRSTEAEIAKFHGAEDCIIFNSLFLGNGFLITAATEKDVIISDADNHCSLIYGVRLSRAKKLIYGTRDLEDLEAKLKESQEFNARHKFIVTDGIFSMDGSIVDIIKTRELADKYNAIIVNDDCHSIGVIGKTGRGTDEYFGVKNYSDIVTNSIGKSASGINGGYLFGSSDFITYLRHFNRQFLTSTCLSIPDYASIREAFRVMEEEPEHLQKLQDNIHYCKDSLLAAGFDITGIKDSGVACVMIGSELLAKKYQVNLIARGIACTASRFPIVATGQARLRFVINAGLTRLDIDQFISTFVEVRKELGGLPEVRGNAIPITYGDPAKRLVNEVLTINK